MPKFLAAAAILSVVTALLFMRAWYWNRSYRDADHNLFWWGAIASAILAVAFTAILMTRSRQAMIAILAGTSLAGLLAVLTHVTSLRSRAALYTLSVPQYPGLMAAFYIIGVHGDWTLFMLSVISVNATLYSLILFLAIHLKYRPERMKREHS